MKKLPFLGGSIPVMNTFNFYSLISVASGSFGLKPEASGFAFNPG
jgi:hypothetical protein